MSNQKKQQKNKSNMVFFATNFTPLSVKYLRENK